MMRLYPGNAFGWDTEFIAKVAIVQSREIYRADQLKCPKSQLIKNESIRWLPNILKIFGYIPGLNLMAGVTACIGSRGSPRYSPNHTANWIGRGVAMIVTGPLLLIVDLIVHLYHLSVAKRYEYEHQMLMGIFNVRHRHAVHGRWPGHPVQCLIPHP